jgi:hypothetical protein
MRINIFKMLLKFAGFLVLLLVQLHVTGQTPDMYPRPVPQPVGIDTFNIILYIVVPILIVVAYFAYRNWKKKPGNRDKR